MGNAHATLTQAGLNIFSIELNVTVVLDPNLQKNYETYEHYGPRFQDSMSFNMYTSGSEINLPNVRRAHLPNNQNVYGFVDEANRATAEARSE